MQRILVVSDLHCGHQSGLTPASWHLTSPANARRTKRDKYAAIRKEGWEWYTKTVAKYRPFDLVICNGDAIDGRSEKSGGTELLVTDRHEQCEMAVACLREAITKGTKVVMTYGTPYHTGAFEDWENMIAAELSAKIGAHEWIDSEGVVFNVKHKISASSIPHGRGTPLAKEGLWAALWADAKKAPGTDVLIRSHVHYFAHYGDRKMLTMSTPALQGMGTKYGARQCSGLIDFGLIVFETDKGTYGWTEELVDLNSEIVEPLKV